MLYIVFQNGTIVEQLAPLSLMEGCLTWKVVEDCLTVKNYCGLLTGDDGVGLVQKYNIRVHRLCVRALRAREAKNVLLAYKNRP